MTEAVIVAAARTPIGRARKGSLVDVDAFRLAEIAVGEAVSRAGHRRRRHRRHRARRVAAGRRRHRPQHRGAPRPHRRPRHGRQPALRLRVSARCRSRAGSIRAGMDRVVIAGGTESLSTSPQTWKVLEPGGEPQMWMSPSHPETPDAPTFDMSITVGENTAREMGLTRLDVDEWAAYSHGRAIASIDSGAFEEEIVPVEYTDREGNAARVQRRRAPAPRRHRRDAGRAQAPPPRARRRRPSPPATRSGINDAAAALVLTSDDYAEAHGLRPLAASCRGRRPASSRPAPAWGRRWRSRRRSSAPA